MTRYEYLNKLADERILLLDGAMGTLVQQKHLDSSDFSTKELNEQDIEYPGLSELLNINRPDVIFDIHNEFLNAGSEIITTNTFCANRINLAEYGLQDYVAEINQAAVECAKAAAEMAEANEESKYVFIAGSVGPTSKMLSFSTDSDDVCSRSFVFDDFVAAYKEQASVLLETGVNILLIETVFDSLICKAALEGIRQAEEETQITKPIMVSVTLSDSSAHTLSGQTLEAFVTSLSSYKLFSLGINCSMGAKEMLPLIEKLSKISPFRVSAHPNAGLPLPDGSYAQTPTEMVNLLSNLLEKGKVNIIGGCCGTTGEHIETLHKFLLKRDKANNLICHPRKQIEVNKLSLSGLESIDKENRLMIVGERCNVAGSKKFLTLIEEEQWEEAVEIAASQASGNADIIDICMDSSMIDGPSAMVTFLRHANCNPFVASKPFMIDSSSFDAIISGLKELQGRCIVNSISLKEGESKFIERAKLINNLGHVMIVMLFDEKGQATTYDRKIEIAKRSYNLLMKNDIKATSIIFDPNVLSVATGIEESQYYALDFLKATRWITQNLRGVSVTGGISNLSFSFRGNNPLRRAMHTVFLHYARLAGFNFAIIAPTINLDINSIDPYIREIIEKALLEPSNENSDKLIELASSDYFLKNKEKRITKSVERVLSLDERVESAIINGGSITLEKDMAELLERESKAGNSPISIVENALMDAMGIVGERFGEGKMFLPQVVKSARTMKLAVGCLQAAIEEWKESALNKESSSKSNPKVVFATVKGDVHDIGKNICILILKCNGFEVIDLGVMVEPELIVNTAIENNTDLICLSGLITPSLLQMEKVCRLSSEKGLKSPILVGGATTSVAHTALKLSSLYNYRVFQTKNASELSTLAMNIIKGQEIYINDLSTQYKDKEIELIQILKEKKDNVRVPYSLALKNRFIKKEKSLTPKKLGINSLNNIDIDELFLNINWKMFAFSYGIKATDEAYKSLIEEATIFFHNPKIYNCLKNSLKAVYGIFPCTSDGINVVVDNREKFSFFRQEKKGTSLSLADYVLAEDYLGMYITTAGNHLKDIIDYLDDGDKIQLQLLATRLAEALSVKVQGLMKEEWGNYILAPAPGYSSCQNHHDKQGIFNLLEGEKNTLVTLNESCMMIPEASVCAFAFQGEDLRYFNIDKVSREQLKIVSESQELNEQKLIEFGVQVQEDK
ncbi:MAG: methionine synthase [Spirochaetaceae bacterium]|nr:methionine synthase [Spirochaetaceae bacterium]